MTEDEIVGWHHRLNGHGFGRTLGVYDGDLRATTQLLGWGLEQP